MKRTTKLISTTACALAAVLWINAPALARYKGTIVVNRPWTMKVSASSTNSDSVAITLIYVDSRGRQDIDQVLSVPIGEKVEFIDLKIPKDTRRIIIEANLPVNSTALISATQGTSMFEETLEDDARVVWDCISAP